MKSFITNGTQAPFPLTPFGLGGRVLAAGEGAIVRDAPAVANLKLGPFASQFRVTPAADYEAVAVPPASFDTRVDGSCHADGSAGTGTNVASASRVGVGQYVITLATALPSTDATRVLVNAHADQSGGPATASGAVLDSLHILIAVNADHGGPVDAAVSFEVLDFTPVALSLP